MLITHHRGHWASLTGSPQVACARCKVLSRPGGRLIHGIEVLRHRLLAHESFAIAFHRRGLQRATHQHEENKHRDEIEVKQSFMIALPADDRTDVCGDEAKSNREIDVHSAHLQSAPGFFDKPGAADQHRESRRKKGDEAEKIGEHEIARHAQIGRQRKRHRIQREGAAEPQTCQ